MLGGHSYVGLCHELLVALHSGRLAVRADLVRDAQILLGGRLSLIHLNGGWPGALRLVHDLDLTLADLNRVRVVRLIVAAYTFLFFAGKAREPLAGSAVLTIDVSFRQTHAIALCQNQVCATSVGNGQRRVGTRLPLLHQLLR